MSYLHGEHIEFKTTKSAKEHIGKSVKYLKKVDVDPHRGASKYPRFGTVEEVINRQTRIGGDWMLLSDISEIVLHP